MSIQMTTNEFDAWLARAQEIEFLNREAERVSSVVTYDRGKVSRHACPYCGGHAIDKAQRCVGCGAAR